MTACHDVSAAPVATAGIRRVALIGSPNAGKTSVFNHLTGLRAKTGNYPGVTVGRSVGTTTVDGVPIAVEDLPGTYSLDPISPDEQVVTDLLAGKYPDIGRPEEGLADVATARTTSIVPAGCRCPYRGARRRGPPGCPTPSTMRRRRFGRHGKSIRHPWSTSADRVSPTAAPGRSA